MHKAVDRDGRRRQLRAARAGRDDARGNGARRRRHARCGPASGKSQTTRAVAGALKDARQARRRRPPPDAVRRPRRAGASSGSRRSRTSTGTSARSRSARSTSRTSRSGTVIYAGVDYGAILEQAQAECDVLLWDGGNNDTAVLPPDVCIAVVDPLRAGHELDVLPRRDQPPHGRRGGRSTRWTRRRPSRSRSWRRRSREREPDARRSSRRTARVTVRRAATRSRASACSSIEDGPTLTHGEMKYRRRRGRGRSSTAPPRSSTRDRGRWARSTRRSASTTSAHVLPAMGYSDGQLAEMEQDHRRGRGRRRRDRHADRPARRHRHLEAGGAGALRPGDAARIRPQLADVLAPVL